MMFVSSVILRATGAYNLFRIKTVFTFFKIVHILEHRLLKIFVYDKKQVCYG